MQLFKTPNFDFIRWRWYAIGLSLVVIIAGAVMMATQGVPLGIDFSGGTIVIVKFDQPVTADRVRQAVETLPGEKVVQQYGDPGEGQWLIRLPQVQTSEQGTSLEQGSQQIMQSLQQAGLPSFEVISTEIVGPVIGAELQRRGIYATLASIVAITLYIAFRFRFSGAFSIIMA